MNPPAPDHEVLSPYEALEDGDDLSSVLNALADAADRATDRALRENGIVLASREEVRGDSTAPVEELGSATY